MVSVSYLLSSNSLIGTQKRYTFSLLEVVIAFSVLIACVSPCIIRVFLLHKKQRDLLFSMELEREAENLYYDILSRPFIFSDIGERSPYIVSLPDISICVDGYSPRRYRCYYHILHHAPKKHVSPYYYVHVHIGFTPSTSVNNSNKDTPHIYDFSFLGKTIDKK